jgi:hypothetical protein
MSVFHSLRNSSWCYPTSRVFSINILVFIILLSIVWICYVILKIKSLIYFKSIELHYNWYQSSFLGQKREVFFFFSQIFQGKKEDGRLQIDF